MVNETRAMTSKLGLYFRSTAQFHYCNLDGVPIKIVEFGNSGGNYIPVAGDWNGTGTDRPGLYARDIAQFQLRINDGPPPLDWHVDFGNIGNNGIPVVGDWDGTGHDRPGLYFKDIAQFHLRISNGPPPVDLHVEFGNSGNSGIPIVGDWDGAGRDRPGLYFRDIAQFQLRIADGPPPVDRHVDFGNADNNGIPVVGNWAGTTVDRPGLYFRELAQFHLRMSNGPPPVDLHVPFGDTHNLGVPVAGNWGDYGHAAAKLHLPYHTNDTNHVQIIDPITFSSIGSKTVSTELFVDKNGNAHVVSEIDNTQNLFGWEASIKISALDIWGHPVFLENKVYKNAQHGLICNGLSKHRETWSFKFSMDIPIASIRIEEGNL
jgi:hypothetical protein